MILTYVRDAEAAQRTVQRIEAAGGRAEAEKLDTAGLEWLATAGYAVLDVNGASVRAAIYNGIGRRHWKTVDLTALRDS